MFSLHLSRVYFLYSYAVPTSRVFWVCLLLQSPAVHYGSTHTGCFSFLSGKKRTHRKKPLLKNWLRSEDIYCFAWRLKKTRSNKSSFYSAQPKICYSSYLWSSLRLGSWTHLPQQRMPPFLMFYFTDKSDVFHQYLWTPPLMNIHTPKLKRFAS